MLLLTKTFISCLISFILVLMPFGQKEMPERKTAPAFNGTFVQSWLSSTWSDEDWAEEIDAMEKDSVKYLVLQDIANMDSEGNWTVYYNSAEDTFENETVSTDVVKNALEAVKGTDIKVFVGLTMFDSFWTTGMFNGDYMKVCKITADMLEEIYSLYYSDYKDNFYGWYYTMELNNILNCQPMAALAVEGLNLVLDKATEVDESLPVMMSPFTSDYLSAGKIPAFVQWSHLFSQGHWRDGDIIAPQDAVGAAWIDEDDLVAVWEMYSLAMKNAKADLKLWANCENFTLAIADGILAGSILRPASENVVSVPATLDRFTKQLDIASRYCENIITFSYTHYYSPVNVSSVYIDTYNDYVDNGFTLEDEAPVMADSFTKAQTEDGVELNWEEATDNIGISHYRILRNGEFLHRAETFDGYHRLSFVDENGSVNDTYTIVAVDGAGNISQDITAK